MATGGISDILAFARVENLSWLAAATACICGSSSTQLPHGARQAPHTNTTSYLCQPIG